MTATRFASKAVEHFDLGNGDWVDLRVLNFGDRQAIKAAMVDPDREVMTQERIEQGNIIALMRSIAAWGGPGFGCTCEGGCKCGNGKPPEHASDCHVMPITEADVAGLDTTGDTLLRLVDAKADRARHGGDPFLLRPATSPSSEAVAAPATSRPTSTSGSSSASGTSTPEPQ